MSKLLVKLISIYQRAVSPDHSERGRRRYPYGYCQYYPSCSEYARQSIEESGAAKGIVKGVWRVLRCNPFSKGGIDLPEPKTDTNSHFLSSNS